MSIRNELELKLKGYVEQNDAIEAKVNDANPETKNMYIASDDATTYRENLKNARQVKAEIDALDGTAELKAFLDAPAEQKSAAMHAAAAHQAGGTAQWATPPKSLGEMVTDSPEFKDLRGGANGYVMRGAVQLNGYDATALIGGVVPGGYGQKDVYGGMSGASHTRTTGFGTTQHDALVPRNMRRARVRDLFPVARTNATSIEFFRVLGFGTDRLDLSSAASVVADYVSGNFGLKPHSSLKFEYAVANVKTIAHYEAAHRNVLADEPQLQSTINNELLYGLRLAEDAQLLNGTGTGEDLLGLLNTPGIQTYDIDDKTGESPADQKQDALRRAATKAILAYYDPTGIVLHPYDWEDIELAKGSDGHYNVSMNVQIGAESRLWRMPVVDSPAIAQGTALVGAFGLGAQIYDRMEASVRVAEQHSDWFVRNAVAILAEERLALVCRRPESFVRVTLT